MPESDRSGFDASVVRDMRHWLEQAVIGLNLCPFAKAVHVRGQVRYAVSHAGRAQELERDLASELRGLVAASPELRDTTLLMAPDCLSDFLEFNDFLHRADRLLVQLGLEGTLQIAGFHPQFQFAGTAVDDLGNYTNRAPYPTLHLLRESSVDRAVAAFPQADAIFERNIETLQRLGQSGWDALGVRRTAPLPQTVPPMPGKRRGKIGP